MWVPLRKLIASILLVGACIYLVVLNRESVKVVLGPTWHYETMLGVVILAAFFIGALVASIIGLWFGFGWFLRERRARSAEKKFQGFVAAMKDARGFAAAGEWALSRGRWDQLVKNDLLGPLGKLEVAKLLKGSGELLEAQKMVDLARGADPQNIEAMFLAAELNKDLGNLTAALDNINLILTQRPFIKALQLGTVWSEELGRYSDGIEFAQEAKRISGSALLWANEAICRMEFKKIEMELQAGSGLGPALTGEDRLVVIRAFLKKNPRYGPALLALASEERAAGNLAQSAEAFELVVRKGSKWSEVQEGIKGLLALGQIRRSLEGIKVIEGRFLLEDLWSIKVTVAQKMFQAGLAKDLEVLLAEGWLVVPTDDKGFKVSLEERTMAVEQLKILTLLANQKRNDAQVALEEALNRQLLKGKAEDGFSAENPKPENWGAESLG